MSKYIINNTEEQVEMTKKESNEAFTGIFNQLEAHEQKEMLEQILPTLNKMEINTLLNYCCERFPAQTSISLVENGIIEDQ